MFLGWYSVPLFLVRTCWYCHGGCWNTPEPSAWKEIGPHLEIWGPATDLGTIQLLNNLRWEVPVRGTFPIGMLLKEHRLKLLFSNINIMPQQCCDYTQVVILVKCCYLFVESCHAQIPCFGFHHQHNDQRLKTHFNCYISSEQPVTPTNSMSCFEINFKHMTRVVLHEYRRTCKRKLEVTHRDYIWWDMNHKQCGSGFIVNVLKADDLHQQPFFDLLQMRLQHAPHGTQGQHIPPYVD